MGLSLVKIPSALSLLIVYITLTFSCRLHRVASKSGDLTDSPCVSLVANLNIIEHLGRCLTLAILTFFLAVLHNEERRGRESNPRIAVLQTATLPLGYPAAAQN